MHCCRNGSRRWGGIDRQHVEVPAGSLADFGGHTPVPVLPTPLSLVDNDNGSDDIYRDTASKRSVMSNYDSLQKKRLPMDVHGARSDNTDIYRNTKGSYDVYDGQQYNHV
jgi:hypothetical protein